MDENRCCLCEGRIVNGICVSCGMKSTSNRYNLNEKRSSTGNIDARRLTGRKVDGSKTKTASTERKGSRRSIYNQGEANKMDTVQTGIRILVIIAVVAILSTGVLSGLVNSFMKQPEEEVHTEIDTEQDLDDEVTGYDFADGEFFSTELEAGMYIVGQHLPAGKYTVTAGEGYAWIQVIDMENGYNFYQNMGSEEGEDIEQVVNNVGLVEGARVDIQGSAALKLETNNAQMSNLSEPEKNHLKEDIDITDGMTVGVELEAGTYDVQWVSGRGVMEIMTDEDIYYHWMYVGDDDYTNRYYCNLVLEDKMKIILDPEYLSEDFAAKFVPSQEVYPGISIN